MIVSLDAWRTARKPERRKITDAILAEHRELELAVAAVGKLGVPVFAHRPSQLLLHLVPGGRFTMGMTDGELAKLQARYDFYPDADDADRHLGSPALRPPTEIDVPAFLLAAQPIGSLEAAPDQPAWDYAALAKAPAGEYLAYLDRTATGTIATIADVAAVERQLLELGLRLPSDAEWERVARGGDERAFTGGDDMPDTPSSGINPFGFRDLGASLEVCADGWQPTLEGIPRDGRARPPGAHRVIRGGAANVYPWQACGEWVLLACACRSSSETTDEGFFTVRPAMSL